ncbi:unnamed protein product [Rhizophagus irregularis]|nr:unnamed protein product [Rhizophagus irregularis]
MSKVTQWLVFMKCHPLPVVSHILLFAHIIEKDENVKEICKMPYLSTSTSPGKWKKCNKNPLKIYNLHLPECSGPPLYLYHLLDKSIKMKVTDNMCSDHSLFFTSLFDGIQLISIVTNNGSIDDDVLLVTDNTAFEEKAVPIPSGSFYRLKSAEKSTWNHHGNSKWNQYFPNTL